MKKQTAMQDWQYYYPFLRSKIPQAYHSWLLDKESLTARLQTLCKPGVFKVQLLNERNHYANLDDAKALGMISGIRVRIREVLLVCENKPLVYARSLIPMTSLKGRLLRLNFQGSKSLGAALFADPTVRRGPIQIIAVDGNTLPVVEKGPVWGRRSLFHVSGQPLLVAEYYLPRLISYK